jgi:hypothetical protein
MEQPPKLERVDKIITTIAEILDRATESATKRLAAYVEIEPKKNQAYATLELFSDQNFCLTYNRFNVKEEGGKKVLDIEYDVENSSETSFIPELDEYQTKIFDGVDYFTEEQENFGPRQSKMLFEWFSKCWQKAGGEHSKTPTYFAMNKEYMCQDILTGAMMT